MSDLFADRIDELDPLILQLSQTSNLSGANLSGTRIKQLRSQYGSQWANLLIEVAHQQDKANKKFRCPNLEEPAGEPIVWWTTNRSLQQATAWQVARLKADWFGGDEVWDLCCGVGGDSMALRHRGPTVAIDRDPLMTDFARANTRHRLTGFTDPHPIEVKTADVTPSAVASGVSVHIDPDRRATDQRTVNADNFSPNWDCVRKLLGTQPSVLVKLAPATQLDENSLAMPFHRCWIELSGSVREQSLVTGNLLSRLGVSSGERAAYRVTADGHWDRFVGPLVSDEARRCLSQSKTVGRWMIDPARAVRAAGLTETFAGRYGLERLGSPSGFLTCQESTLSPEIQSMSTLGQVLWSGSMDDRKLRRQLRSQNWFPETIKCRGTDHDPARLFRQYKDCGDQPIKLWVGRSSSKTYAAITS